jgi:predicted DNA-binding protein (MmcQ/YjbR family)
MDINKIKEEIIAFYKNNPQTELKAKDIAEKFGLDLGDREKTNKYVRDLKRVAFGTRHSLKSAFKSFVNELKNFKEDFSKGTLESTISIDFEPKSVEELYKEHKINPQFYVIKNYWSKKQPNGNFTSSVFAVKKTIETAEPKDL